jgi:prolyl oligopeptidase
MTLSSLVGSVQAPLLPAPPDTPKHPVTDEYHGVKITDDYRWLENWDDPQVKQWSTAENARTRSYLDHLSSRSFIKSKLEPLMTQGSDDYYSLQFRGGRLFAMRHDPSKQQAMVVALKSPDDRQVASVVCDPNSMRSDGSLGLDFYVPSHDGRYVAAALSLGGSEDASAHIFEVATGKELADVVPRVNFATAGGSIEWAADNAGFYYTRYPQGNERPSEDANFYQQIYFHKLGTDPRQDTYVLGKDFPRIAEIQLRSSDDAHWILASVANGDGGEFSHYVMDVAGHWTQVTRNEDGVVAAKAGADAYLYLLSHRNAPRGQILRVPLENPKLALAKVFVPQSSGGPDENSRASIEDFVPAAERMYVVDIVGGPSRLRVFDANGKALPPPSLPPVSAIQESLHAGGGNFLFYVSSFLEPSVWYRFDVTTGKSSRTALYQNSPIKFEDAEVVRQFAVSKDGTRVPLNIIRRKGAKLDGAAPTLLYGYGGYSISEKPRLVPAGIRLWLDQGGIFVVANIRGGSEYGEEWHNQGKLTHKQNVFDDFIACSQYLIGNKYTSPAHLAIWGGSNGGLLMGAVLTQHPELFRAVVAFVGIYDMLRVELDPNGAFNTTEYGSVRDREQFMALYAYSPYHHVKDGTAYPSVILFTGENDHRVNPMQSRKMAARLQAATSSAYPVLLRTSSNAGHGFATPVAEQIEEQADMYSFLFEQLRIKDYSSPK